MILVIICFYFFIYSILFIYLFTYFFHYVFRIVLHCIILKGIIIVLSSPSYGIIVLKAEKLYITCLCNYQAIEFYALQLCTHNPTCLWKKTIIVRWYRKDNFTTLHQLEVLPTKYTLMSFSLLVSGGCWRWLIPIGQHLCPLS